MVGQRFNKLLVIERAGAHQKNVRWKCRCDCGREQVFRTCNLPKGSCGACRSALKASTLTFPFYAYVYKDQGVPFYVGAGVRERPGKLTDHMTGKRTGSALAKRMQEIEAAGREVEIHRIGVNTLEDAHEIERTLILLYKREGEGGTLVNVHQGGIEKPDAYALKHMAKATIIALHKKLA